MPVHTHACVAVATVKLLTFSIIYAIILGFDDQLTVDCLHITYSLYRCFTDEKMALRGSIKVIFKTTSHGAFRVSGNTPVQAGSWKAGSR